MAGGITMTRRDFLAAGVAGLVSVTAARARVTAPESADQMEWLPGWRIRELVVSKQVSPVEVVEFFLDRIDRLDSRLGRL